MTDHARRAAWEVDDITQRHGRSSQLVALRVPSVEHFSDMLHVAEEPSILSTPTEVLSWSSVPGVPPQTDTLAVALVLSLYDLLSCVGQSHITSASSSDEASASIAINGTSLGRAPPTLCFGACLQMLLSLRGGAPAEANMLSVGTLRWVWDNQHHMVVNGALHTERFFLQRRRLVAVRSFLVLLAYRLTSDVNDRGVGVLLRIGRHGNFVHSGQSGMTIHALIGLAMNLPAVFPLHQDLLHAIESPPNPTHPHGLSTIANEVLPEPTNIARHVARLYEDVEVLRIHAGLARPYPIAPLVHQAYGSLDLPRWGGSVMHTESKVSEASNGVRYGDLNRLPCWDSTRSAPQDMSTFIAQMIEGHIVNLFGIDNFVL